LQDAAPQFRWRTSDTINRTDDVFHQLIDILAAIGEFLWLETKLLHRGEFRGVGGKMLDPETRVLTEELLEWFPLMGGGVIQENDDGAGSAAVTHAETHRPLPCDVVIKEQIVEAHMVSLGLSEIPEMTEILSRRPWR